MNVPADTIRTGWTAMVGDDWVPAPCVQTHTPPSSRYATGYGRKIATSWKVHHLGRWRRVWSACYGNAGTAYLIVNGEWCIVHDTMLEDTEK